jgi:hypothetical protein
MRIHNPVITGSLVVSGSISTEGQPAGTVASASYAITASYAENGGGGGGFPHTGSAIISGSQQVTGSVSFSYASYGSGVWSSGGNLIQQRTCGGGFGTQNAAAFAGGTYVGGNCCNTEHYDGSSWTTGGNLLNAHGRPGTAGTLTSGLIFGGEPHPAYSNCTAEYDGSSWSSGGALIQARYELAGAGTQNAALAHGGRNYFGGAAASTTYYACTEEYNGTSWSTGGALAIARHGLGGAGTQNAGIAFGGECTGEVIVACTEEYDGTSWTIGGNLITGRKGVGSGGTQNQTVTFGGTTPSSPYTSADTELYDGSSWSSGTAMTTATNFMGSTNDSTANLSIGGSAPSATCVTQEYTLPNLSQTTFDYSSITGETTVSCLIETSAARYKDNIQPMGSQLNKVMQLKPVEFDWKSNKKHDIGFVADSVKNVYPNLVSEKDGQVEGMNYSKLVSALVKSIQEQQDQINDLKLRLDNNN